jgi:hypothetical protein
MNNLQLEELFLPSFLYFSIDNCSIPSTEKRSGDAIQRLKPATSWITILVHHYLQITTLAHVLY